MAHVEKTQQTRPRMLVPDVARGLALLGIALANAPTAWFIDEIAEPADYFGGAHDAADRLTVFFTAITAHVRGLPMFSTLLGFGVGLIALSLWRRGFPVGRARAVIAKRYGILALFGLAHGIFLFLGDIMFYYGCVGLVLCLLLTLRTPTLNNIAYGLLAVVTLFGVVLAAASFGMPDIAEEMNVLEAYPDSYGQLLLVNLGFIFRQAVGLPFFLVSYLGIFIIGFNWARQGVLADVPAHRRQLRVWAVVGVVISLGCGVPWALAELGYIPGAGGFMMLNQVLGVFTGPAILAWVALALQGVQERVWAGARVPVWVAVPAALGKRSMSGYLFQSVCFAVVAYPFFLGLDLDAFGMSALGFGIWAVSLALAWLLELAGKPGPFEWLHRRLAYGPTGRAQL